VAIVFGYAPGGYGGGEVPAHREAVEELAEKVTAEGAERAAAAGVECEIRLKPLKPPLPTSWSIFRSARCLWCPQAGSGTF
jgi:hypothetical protein